jgi:hypothetical protein
MTALLVTLVGVLSLVVLGLGLLTLRLSRKVARLEGAEGAEAAGHPITRVGEMEPVPSDEPVVAASVVPDGRFADIVLRESVIRGASLVHGLRRALAPETVNRIRFEMRREVKRSRKQRRADLRTARREWEARQREALDDDVEAETAA